MPNKKEVFLKHLLHLILRSFSFFNLTDQLTRFIKTEANIAIKRLTALIALSFVLATLLITIWACLLCVVFLSLRSLQVNEVMSAFIILILNILLLLSISLLLKRRKKNLLFLRTRKKIRHDFFRSDPTK